MKFAIFALIAFIPTFVLASGTHVTNGGDGVACFSRPLVESERTGRISAALKKEATAVYLLDFWLLKQTSVGSAVSHYLRQQQDLYQNNTSSIKNFYQGPLFASRFGQEFSAAAFPERGVSGNLIESPDGLRELPDEDFESLLPANCRLVQAVSRPAAGLDTYYADSWVLDQMAMNPELNQLPLLYLHEMIGKVMATRGPCYKAERVYSFVRSYLTSLAASNYQPNDRLDKGESCADPFLCFNLESDILRHIWAHQIFAAAEFWRIFPQPQSAQFAKDLASDQELCRSFRP